MLLTGPNFEGERAVLGRIKGAPGNVSLDTMLTEIDTLLTVRAIGVSAVSGQDGRRSRAAPLTRARRRCEARWRGHDVAVAPPNREELPAHPPVGTARRADG
jgi:hypothetical protein